MLVGPLGQLCLFFVVKRSKEHGRGKVSYDAQVNRFGARGHGDMVGSRGMPKVKRDSGTTFDFFNDCDFLSH